jgi:hypothetical protein
MKAYVGIKTVDCPNKTCIHYNGSSRFDIAQTFARLPTKKQKEFIDILRAAKKMGEKVLDFDDQEIIDKSFEALEELIEELLDLN